VGNSVATFDQSHSGFSAISCEAAAKLGPPKEVKLKDPKDWKIAGKPVKRLDTADTVNGKVVYGIDLKFPGMLVEPATQIALRDRVVVVVRHVLFAGPDQLVAGLDPAISPSAARLCRFPIDARIMCGQPRSARGDGRRVEDGTMCGHVSGLVSRLAVPRPADRNPRRPPVSTGVVGPAGLEPATTPL
jgi:hypothetical protein